MITARCLTSRKILIIAVAIFFAASATFLPAAEKVKITMWGWQAENIELAAQDYMARDPSVAIEILSSPGTEYDAKLATALQGNVGPDVMELRTYSPMEALAMAGFLLPLDDKVPGLKMNFGSATLEAATSRDDGKIYYVPLGAWPAGIFYNKALFKKCNVTAPTTWNEFLDVCKALKKAGIVPIALGGRDGWLNMQVGFALQPTLFGGKAWYNDAIKGKTNFMDPRFVDSLKKMDQLRPYFEPNPAAFAEVDSWKMFVEGQAAMVIIGAWQIATARKDAPDIDIDTFAPPVAKAGDPYYTTMMADGGFGINAKTKHQAECVKLLTYLSSKEYGKLVADKNGAASAVLGVSVNDPTMKKILEIAGKSQLPQFMEAYFNQGKPGGEETLTAGLQAMFAGQKTPEQVAKELQDTVAKWYKPFQK